MNRAMATVARMNHLEERHCQCGGLVSKSPMMNLSVSVESEKDEIW